MKKAKFRNLQEETWTGFILIIQSCYEPLEFLPALVEKHLFFPKVGKE